MIINGKINSSKKLKWRCVPLPVTVRIANMCSSGVNFGGCSKSDIYESMERGRAHNFYKSDIDTFIRLMDVAAGEIPKLQEEMNAKLNRKLKEAHEEKSES